MVRLVKDGDIEAFSILVEKYHRHLLNFIYSLVGDEDIVEDIGQEVFLSVYKSLKNFDDNRSTPFSAWLFITARNRCISELRKKRGRKMIALEDAAGIIADDKTGMERLIENERRQAVKASLEQLPEHHRSIILRSLQGDSMDEIAKGEDIAPGTAKSRLFRARERLKIFVREYFGGKGYEKI